DRSGACWMARSESHSSEQEGRRNRPVRRRSVAMSGRTPAERTMPPDRPATYAIWVRGVLDRGWSERLGGLHAREVQTGGHANTELVGTLGDQAALAGVLKTLNDLGLPIVSLDRLAEVEPEYHAAEQER